MNALAGCDAKIRLMGWGKDVFGKVMTHFKTGLGVWEHPKLQQEKYDFYADATIITIYSIISFYDCISSDL